MSSITFATSIMSAFYNDKISYDSVLSIVSRLSIQELEKCSNVAPELLVFKLGIDAKVTIEPTDQLLRFSRDMISIYELQTTRVHDTCLRNHYEMLLNRNLPIAYLELGVFALANMTMYSLHMKNHFFSGTNIQDIHIPNKLKDLFIVYILSLHENWEFLRAQNIDFSKNAITRLVDKDLINSKVVGCMNTESLHNLYNVALSDMRKLIHLSRFVNLENYRDVITSSDTILALCCVYGYNRTKEIYSSKVGKLSDTAKDILDLLEDIRRFEWRNATLIKHVRRIVREANYSCIDDYIRIHIE